MKKGQEREPGKDLDFSPASHQVLVLAREEALSFNHNYIGSEHILLGLIREGTVVETLEKLNVSLPKIHSTVEFITGRGDRLHTGEIGFTPRTKKITELAIEEARRNQATVITPFHLLNAVVKEGEGIAAGILAGLGVSYEKVRALTILADQKRETAIPEIVSRLRETLEDPNIDQTTKDRITNIIDEIINLSTGKSK